MAVIGSIYSARKAVHLAELAGRTAAPDHAQGMPVILAFHDVLIFAILIQALVFVSSLAPKLIRRHRD